MRWGLAVCLCSSPSSPYSLARVREYERCYPGHYILLNFS